MTQVLNIDASAIAQALQPMVETTVADAIKRLAEMPAQKTAGIISQDGGTADPEVKTFADFLLACARQDTKRLQQHYGSSIMKSERGETKAALAEGSGVTGGWTVPAQFIPEILQIAGEDAIIRPKAFKQRMTTRTAQIPFLDQTTAQSAGKTAFYGGMQAYWTGEAGAYTETEPTFRLMELVAHKLSGYTLSSQELLDDSAVGIESLLKTLIGKTIAWYEDYAFLRGDGVAKPLGIQNAAASIAVTRTAGGNSFEYADLKAMIKRLLPSSAKNAFWLAHPFLLPDFLDLQQANNSLLTWNSNLRDGVPSVLLGLPIVFSEKLAAPGSAFDLALVDPSYYVIGDRQALAIASSEHYKFINGQMTWRFDYRVDGQPWLNSAITLADGTNTVSPFVYLS